VRRARVLLGLIVSAALTPLPSAVADVIHLKNGSTVKVAQWWDQQGEIRYRRAGGVIGIPKDQIERIESSPNPIPAPVRPPTVPGIAPRRDGVPQRAAQPPLPLQAPTDDVSILKSNDAAAWRERLKSIEASIGRPGVRESAARREAAILHTLLGNDAARSGDLDGAESEYRLASDQDPNLPAPMLNLARVRMTEGRNSDAENLVGNALVLRPEDPTGLAILGEIAYRTDRLPEAIDLWERSLKRESDADLAARLSKARRQLAAEQDYYRSDAPHFTLKYDGDKASEALGREILDHLETTYSDLTSRFNVYPASVIIVTLYPRDAFYDVTQSPKWVGGLFDGQIRIPIGGLTRLTNEARSVFTHELTHCIVYHKTHGNCPKWLQEGIAQWQEGKTAKRADRDFARKYARATPADVGAEFSYPLALSLVEHFLRVHSFSHLLDLLEALGHGSDLEAAFQSSTGQGYEEFVASWIRDLPAGGAS